MHIIDITRIFPDSLLRMFFEAVLWSILFRSFSQQKVKKLISFLLMLICPWAVISLITVLWKYPDGFGGLIIYTIYLVIYVLCYEGKVLKKVLEFAMAFASYFAISIITTAFIDLFFKDMWNYDKGLKFNQYTILTFLVQYVLPIIFAFPVNGIIRYVKSKKTGNCSTISKYTVGYLLMPLSQISFFVILSAVLSEFFNYGFLFDATNDYRFAIPTLITFGISLLADWYIFAMVDKTETANRKNIELIAKNNKNEIEYNSIIQMQNENKKLKKVHHDIVNQHLAVSFMLKQENIEEAVKLLDTVEENIENVIYTAYCSNNLINTILQLENQKAEKASVELNITAECNKSIEIGDTDLCSLLTNIIDNAIEAAEKVEGTKSVKIICKAINSAFAVHIENPFKGSEKKKKNFFSSLKADTNMHGIGMSIVRQIVKKYNGKMDYEINKNTFSLDIILCC